MLNTTTLIHVSNATRKKLAEDLERYFSNTPHAPIDDTVIDGTISRAQAFPDNHLLDVMYQQGLRAAVKILISYFALPMITYSQSAPMHGNFFTVFDFCGHWVASSPFHEIDVTTEDHCTSFHNIKKSLSMIFIPEVRDLRTRDFTNKQDFLDVFNVLRSNWNQADLLMPSIFGILQSILDFPTFDLIDNPVTRMAFVTIIKNLTACWAESVWNWYDFDFDVV